MFRYDGVFEFSGSRCEIFAFYTLRPPRPIVHTVNLVCDGARQGVIDITRTLTRAERSRLEECIERHHAAHHQPPPCVNPDWQAALA